MTKSAQKEPGAIGKFVISCCKCCLYCFQKFIQFLNKKAYIQTIMTSKSFCPAAKEGLFLVLRNPLRVGITAGLGMVFQLLGTISITVATTIIGHIIITKSTYYNTKISQPLYPDICFGILAFCVSSIFMSLYGTSADAVCVLFCMDEEMHKNVKSKNTPPELEDIINNH